VIIIPLKNCSFKKKLKNLLHNCVLTANYHTRSSKEFEKKLAKLALLLSLGFPQAVAFPYAFLRWIMPCNPATFAYRFIPECQNINTQHGEWAFSSTLKLIFICMISIWLVIDGAGSFTIFVIEFSFIQAYCLRRYVQYITQLLRDKPLQANAALLRCRQVQILSHCYNLIQQDGLIISTL